MTEEEIDPRLEYDDLSPDKLMKQLYEELEEPYEDLLY